MAQGERAEALGTAVGTTVANPVGNPVTAVNDARPRVDVGKKSVLVRRSEKLN